MHPSNPRHKVTANSKPGSRIGRELRRIWAVFWLSVKSFFRINATQWAAAFAFNAFSSLFPLVVLLVTIASVFIDKNRAATAIISHIESYVPISGEMQAHITDTIAGVINARHKAGAVASLILVWTSLQCFTTLICVTNVVWCLELHNWWRLPLKSLSLLGITASAILLGMAAPVVMRMAEGWLLPVPELHSWVRGFGRFFIPWLVVFVSLSLFYKLAPRRKTRFEEVWAAALCATLLLQGSNMVFVIYLKDFATLNAVYGAFGGLVALLLWIYIAGCVFIFGVCLCASHAQVRGKS